VSPATWQISTSPFSIALPNSARRSAEPYGSHRRRRHVGGRNHKFRLLYAMIVLDHRRIVGSIRRDWDRNRARPAVGGGFRFPLFRLQDGCTFPPWLTFPDAPLIIPDGRSGLKPWHFFRGPSQDLERFKRWSVDAPAVLVCPPASPLLNSRRHTPVLSSRPLAAKEA
jgi:hypothetical protein